MQWALADVDAAADLMRAAFDDAADLRAATRSLSARLADTYSEATIGRRMMELLT